MRKRFRWKIRKLGIVKVVNRGRKKKRLVVKEMGSKENMVIIKGGKIEVRG